MSRSRPFAESVRSIVGRIPYGRVASYGDIAALAGQPRAARGVGRVLSELPSASDVPWWRVVKADGEISIRHPGRQMQMMLLRQEGVRFASGGRIDLSRYRWRADQ